MFNISKKFAAASAAMMFAVSYTGYFNITNTEVISAVSGEYRSWKQSDPEWGNLKLGTSSYTMADSGCAVTSLASLVVHSGCRDEDSFDPGVFCKFLNENNGFNYSGDIYWGTVSKLVPEFRFAGSTYLHGTTEEEKTTEIKKYLDDGYYIISDVKYTGHWVAVDRIENGVVYSIDPASYTTNNLFDQYDFRGATRLKLFTVGEAPVSVTPSETPKPEKIYETGTHAVIDNLNMRKGPSTSYDKIQLLSPGTEVNVTEVSSNWGRINLNGTEGWICLDYTNKLEEPDTTENDEKELLFSTGKYVTNDVINHREKPDVSSASYGLITTGVELTITEVSGHWGRTVYNDRDCWVCLDYADLISPDIPSEGDDINKTPSAAETSIPEDTVPESNTGEKYITTDALNFRTGAGIDNPVICVIPENTEVTVTIVSDNWGMISYKENEGWICLDYAQKISPSISETPAVTVPLVTDVVLEPVTGDIDGNGTVNILDLIQLKSFLIGEGGEINDTADINCDGIISSSDLISLRQMLFSL